MKTRLLALLCYSLVTTGLLAQPCITLTCPSNIVVSTCSNCLPVSFAATASNSCCQSNVVLNYSFSSGTCFPLGTTTVNVTAYDPDCTSTPPATCSFMVTVLPNTNGLDINCSNMVVVSCTNTQVFYSPTVTDPCCLNWTLTYTPTNGSYFAPGTTNTVQCQVVDWCGLSNNCSFTVAVLAPTNCPTNCLTVQCPTNQIVNCSSNWTFDTPTATSCCTNYFSTGTGSLTNVLITPISTVTNGACPQVDITETWQITDGCGDSTNCSQTVTVIGCCPTNCITLTCPSNIVATTCSNCVPVYYTITATNACCSNHVAFSYNYPSGTCFGLGTNTVQVTAYDPDCASTPPATCSFTVTVSQGTNCCFNPYCCGPGLGLQTINWLEVPTNGTLNPDPLGNNTNGTWFITNLPCYGRVLVTQDAPTNVEVVDFQNANFDNAPNSIGTFDFTEASYGPYQWGITPGYVDPYYNQNYTINGTNAPLPPYNVNFYFLDGQPNPCGLVLAVIGLAEQTTNTISQPVTFRTEFDLVHVSLYPSAYTMFANQFGSGLIPGVSGTVVGSAYDASHGYGDDYNTGWAVFQPDASLQTITLPPGSGSGWPGPLTNVPYLTVTVNSHEPGDGFGLTVGYICCTNCPTNCLQVQCLTNKTVQCGSGWTFDPPTATSCCTNYFSTGTGSLTNVMITSVSTVTNGGCSQVITQTWLIADACGDTDTCTQVVTVVNTNVPVILNCPPPPIIVPLNPNCQMVIPPIHLLATEPCTPASSLIWSQSPPAGSIFPPSSVLVTVTVTDPCGHTSSCHVIVQSQVQTGPIINCPANMTVTNCTVPLVPVTVLNNCCPFAPIITQSPPPGSSLCPGINSVRVTVTDCHGFTTTKTVSLTVAGPESFLENLTNTGAATPSSSLTPTLLPDAVQDVPYSVPAMATSGLCGAMPADYNVAKAPVVVSTACYGYSPCAYNNSGCYEYVVWDLTSTNSKWIAPNFTNNGCDPCGLFTYSMQFDLPVGINPATATISGRFAVDNAIAGLNLNGNPVPIAPGSFTYWTPFTIPAGSLFMAGPNTLTFVVDNWDSWTGLRVEFTNAYGNCCTCAPPVPQPTVYETLPLGSFANFTVSPGGTPPFTYQWYKGVPLVNSAHYSGVTTSTLGVHPIGFADAGVYYCVISNACGVATDYFQLRVTLPLPFTNAWWKVAVLTNPLAATIGPDLIQAGTSVVSSNYSITSGTTDDLGLPEEGGQIVNVMHILPNASPFIQIPMIAAAGSSIDTSYTLLMDLYEPDTSMGTPSTLFESIDCCVTNLGSGGQDGGAITLDSSNELHIVGSAAGAPFDTGPAALLAVDAWNRVALVVDDPQDGVAVNLSLYLNGLPIANLTVPTPVGLPINWSNSVPILLSADTNATANNGEFYASSIQFYAAGLSPQAIASMGSPEIGPAPVLVSPAGGTGNPVLTATQSGGQVSITWSGSPFVLQETTDLAGDAWVNSMVPFTEIQVKGMIMNTATINLSDEAPAKFYRLANDAQTTSDASAQGQ